MNGLKLRIQGWAGRTRTRFAASRAGIKWAALPPRTQRLVAGGGCGVLVLVLVAGLVLGPLSGHGSGGSAATPGVAAASSSKSSAASANATPIAAKVLATVDCTADFTPPVTANGVLYVSCDSGANVIGIDLTTDKVAKTYKLSNPYKSSPDTMVVDNGLWVSFSNDDGTAFDVQRIDLSTGAKAAEFKNSSLIGEVNGTILMTDADENMSKVNPTTGAKTAWKVSGDVQDAVGDPTGYVPVACGKIWDINETDYVGGVDPATGKETDVNVDTTDGEIADIVQSGNTCWAEIDTASGDGDYTTDPMTLVPLGTTCLGKTRTTGQPYLLGDTFWEISSTGIDQVDPEQGKVGPKWLVSTTKDSWLTLVGDQVWLYNGTAVVRLDIPLDQMAPAPSATTITCDSTNVSGDDNTGDDSGNDSGDDTGDEDTPTDTPSPAVTPSHSPSLSPSPSPSPSPTPTPSKSPTPSPSPTSSPSTVPSDSPTASDSSAS